MLAFKAGIFGNMNQILVNKKIYVTPELKRKKKLYKFNFILSLFLIIILASIAIYAEYDRNKSEQVSRQLLADMDKKQEEVAKSKLKSDVLTVILDNTQEDINIKTLEAKENETPKRQKYTTPSGYNYYSVATINIPKLKISYPVIQGETETEKETEELLKMSPCKLEGPEPNEIGNFCIVGHNYRNNRFFSKIQTLLIGDKVQITDLKSDGNSRTITYEIYSKYIVVPEDVSCLDQETKGQKEITLITCTDDSQKRIIIKAREQ